MISIDCAEDILSLPENYFRCHPHPSYKDANYDPRKLKPLEDKFSHFKFLHLDYYRFQLNDLRKNVLAGNAETAKNYFRRKVGEVKEVVREMGALEEEIIRKNLGLPFTVIGSEKFQDITDWLTEHGADRAEQLSTAYFALLNAVRYFNPHRGIKFSTYCVNSILGEFGKIKSHLMRQKVPNEERRMGDFENEMTGEIETNSAIEDIVYRRGPREDSPESPVIVKDLLVELEDLGYRKRPRGNSPESPVIVEDLLENLNDEERIVITMRHLSGPKPHGYREIGTIMQTSNTSVMRTEDRALRKLELIIDPLDYYHKYLPGKSQEDLRMHYNKVYRRLRKHDLLSTVPI